MTFSGGWSGATSFVGHREDLAVVIVYFQHLSWRHYTGPPLEAPLYLSIDQFLIDVIERK